MFVQISFGTRPAARGGRLASTTRVAFKSDESTTRRASRVGESLAGMEGSPARVVRNAPRMKSRSPVVAPSASRPPRGSPARASSDAPNLGGWDGASVRGSSDAAPLGVDDDARATRRSPPASETETVSSPPTLDCKAKPPLPARAEAPHRVTPASLHAALKANASMSTGEPYVLVVDVRPRHLSDAASLRGAMRVPLAELEARVGEVRAASDAMRDRAYRIRGGYLVPLIGLAICLWLTAQATAENWRTVGILLAIGFVLYALERRFLAR